MSEKNEWKQAEALRESLLWAASSLAAVGKEQDVIVLEGRKRTIGEILDEANAALDAPSAPGDAQDERQGWMECEMRHRMVTDNLRLGASHLRDKEHRCRNAYQLEYMGAPMRWLADAYAEAAAVFEAKLAALAAQVPHKGDAA